MHFSSWMWEQLENGDSTAKFAKICWDDVNNGCAHPKFNAAQWLEHFKKKHSEKIDLLTDMLVKVYTEYLEFKKAEK